MATVVVWSAVGFSWFGPGFDWVTNASADRRVEQAVLTSQAEICAAQARSASDAAAELEKLAELSVWKQSEFVEEAQWSTMPGSDSARRGVATECAKILRGAS